MAILLPIPAVKCMANTFANIYSNTLHTEKFENHIVSCQHKSCNQTVAKLNVFLKHHSVTQN